jgi:hypothetical protein
MGYGLLFVTQAVLWALYFSNNTPLSLAQNSDFTVLWVGIRLLTSGHGPQLYDLNMQDQLADVALGTQGAHMASGGLPYIYPPWTAAGMAPLALGSFEQAFVLWFAFNLLLIGLAIYMLIQIADVPRGARGPLALALLSWAPLFLVLKQGQISLVPLVGLAGAVLALRRRRDSLAGIWLIVGLFKPQFLLFPLLALLLERRWRALLSFGIGATGFVAGSVALAGFWLPGYNAITLAAVGVETHFGVVYRMQNWRGLVNVLLNSNDSGLAQTITTVLTVLSGGLVLALFWPGLLHRRISWEARFAVAILLNILIIPHMYIYDLVVALVPGALLYGVATRRGGDQRAAMLLTGLLAAGPLVLLVAQFWYPVVLSPVPWYLVLLVAVTLWIFRRDPAARFADPELQLATVANST